MSYQERHSNDEEVVSLPLLVAAGKEEGMPNNVQHVIENMYASGRSEDEILEVYIAAKMGCDKNSHLKLLAQAGLNSKQIDEIYKGLSYGLPLSSVEIYAKNVYSEKDMANMRDMLLKGVDPAKVRAMG